MTRKSTILAIFLLAMIGAGPAQAFCVDNRSPYELRVHLETSNPLGEFAVLFEPGERRCCAWFSQRCNPTRARDGMLIFTVRTRHDARYKLYCASGWVRRVYGTANGNIEITEQPGSLGGLHCDSRDYYRRPVTQQTFLNRHKKRGMPPPIIVPPPY